MKVLALIYCIITDQEEGYNEKREVSNETPASPVQTSIVLGEGGHSAPYNDVLLDSIKAARLPTFH